MDTLLPSQPESYTQLIKRSLKLYRQSFKHVLLFSFLMAVVVFIPRFLSYLIGQDLFLNLKPLDFHRLWLFIINVAGLIFFISLLWRMHGVICQAHEPLTEDLSLGIKRVFYVVVAAILQSALAFGTTIIILGLLPIIHHYLLPTTHFSTMILIMAIFVFEFFLIIYIYTLFAFLTPLIAIEKKGILSALQRSAYLVWNHWWRTFSVQVTPWFSYLLLLFLLKYAFKIDVHIYFIESSHHHILGTLINMILFIVYIPWVAALLLVQLKDLELRKQIHENAYTT